MQKVMLRFHFLANVLALLFYLRCAELFPVPCLLLYMMSWFVLIIRHNLEALSVRIANLCSGLSEIRLSSQSKKGFDEFSLCVSPLGEQLICVSGKKNAAKQIRHVSQPVSTHVSVIALKLFLMLIYLKQWPQANSTDLHIYYFLRSWIIFLH